MQQRGGHDEILAGDLQVHLAHQVQVRGVLLGDGLDRDVGDLDLIDAHEVQQ